MDPTATFIKRFGDLVTLLRVDPGNDAAQDLALSAAAAAVQTAPVELELLSPQPMAVPNSAPIP